MCMLRMAVAFAGTVFASAQNRDHAGHKKTAADAVQRRSSHELHLHSTHRRHDHAGHNTVPLHSPLDPVDAVLPSSSVVVDPSCPSRAEAAAVRFDSMLCLRRGCAAWPFPTLRPSVKLASFPEENTTLAIDRQTGDGVDYGALGTRERLFRRIVAKLLRAGVIDASAAFIEAGMAVGDNAVPWASLLAQLRPADPPTVFAIDPNAHNCLRTLRLARLNGVQNLCLLQRALGGSDVGTVRVETRCCGGRRVPVASLDGLAAGGIGGVRAAGLPRVGFIHLDIEGAEQAALEAAARLVARHRPVVVTERHTEAFNDSVLLRHGYRVRPIPEVCGPVSTCRNRLWVPVERWAGAMGAVGALLDGPLRPEQSPHGI